MSVLANLLADHAAAVGDRWRGLCGRETPKGILDVVARRLRDSRATVDSDAHRYQEPVDGVMLAREIMLLGDALLDVAEQHAAAVTARETRTLFKILHELVAALALEPLQRRVREESAQLQTVIGSLPSALAVVDAQTGKTILANDRGPGIFGKVPDERRRKLDAAAEFVGLHPDGRRLTTEEWPIARSLRNGDEIRGEIIEIVKADGDHGYIRVSSAPIRDETGRIVQGVVIFDDITELRRAELGIRLIADASRALASSLDVEVTLQTVAQLLVPALADWAGVELVQEDGTSTQVAIAHVNPEKVALARELRQRYPPDPNSPGGVPEVIRSGKPQIISEITDAMLVAGARDEEHLRIARELHLRSAMTVPLTARGKTFGALSLVAAESGRRYGESDLAIAEKLATRAASAVDNARLYDEAQRALRWRNEFISVAAHELRTPLTSLSLQVGAFVHAIKGGQPLTTNIRRIERMQRQVERLTSLVNTVLDVSRVSEGRLQLEAQDADFVAIVDEVVSGFEDQADGRIRWQAPPAAVRGHWDAARLEQVVTNLVSNALKFGADKPVHVAVSVDRDHAVLSVRDSGIGISPGDQERIFGRFERAATPRNFAGLGLGLWITKQIVEAHRGAICVQSELNGGSEFTVRLPLSESPVKAAPRRG